MLLYKVVLQPELIMLNVTPPVASQGGGALYVLRKAERAAHRPTDERAGYDAKRDYYQFHVVTSGYLE